MIEHDYLEPEGYINVFEFLRFKHYQVPALVGHALETTTLYDKYYIVSSVLLDRTNVPDESENVEFPNPKRGYIAITTFPPVYRTYGNGRVSDVIVVPRVYPPIFIPKRRRGQ